MAQPAGTSTRTHRLIGLAAALLLAGTTALAFGRVFLGATTTLRLLATAIAAAGLAVLFERRSLLLSTIVSAAGLALAVGLVVFPGTTWYGLPTDETLRSALDAAALVGEQARIQIAPAEPIAPLLLAAVVSLWAAVFSAHALAFRAGSPLLGLIPPVALVAFADTVLEEFVKPLYGVAFLAAALLVVFADGLARVQGWGPVWSSARRGVAANAGRGARRLGLTALAAAVLAPIVVPGFGSRAVIDFGTAAEDRVSIDPFVSVKSFLSREDPIEVLRVTSPRPTYVRLVSAPNFDGATWSPATDTEGVVVSPGAPMPTDTGVDDPTEPVVLEVTTDLGIPWLPTVYPVRSIDAPGVPVRFDTESDTTFLETPLEEGTTYEVETSFPDATSDQLRTAVFGDPAAGDPYLALPSDMPPRIEEIAREVTQSRMTVFDKAMAIQDYLRDRSRFSYSDETAAQGGTQTILDFLENTRTGFCQQFATSMAALLRSIDIPARVVVGFATGTQVGEGSTWSISTRDAHSWVEVRFPGFGWMPFEPTPNRQNPVIVGYTAAPSACTGPTCPGGETGTGGGSAASSLDRNRVERVPPAVREALGPRGAVGGPGSIETTDDPGISARGLLALGTAVVAIALLLMPPARALLRRRRLRRAAAEPRRFILVAYEQFSEQVSGLGLGRALGETLEEYRRKVMDTGYLSDGHLDRLTRIATSAAYSGREPDRAQAREAGDAADTALREIRRAVGPMRWFAGLYRRR